MYVKLDATADLDLKLIGANGTILIMYDTSARRWIHGSTSLSTAIDFEHNGMNFKSCVDSCKEDITITVRF